MTKTNLDQIPLWVAFPTMLPHDLRSDQGTWYSAVQQWREFWLALTPIDQADYLDHWSASREWREAIEFHFTEDETFDATQDAKESEEYLEGITDKQANASLWKRIFRN